MRFKKLLFEVDKTLEKKIKDEYLIPRQYLIRGTNKSTELFEERKIRKDRKPRDTSQISHDIISALEDGYYPSVPKRRQSKYATVWPKMSFAENFGSNIVVVFPHKSANIASFEKDSIEYLSGLAPGFDLIFQYIEKENYPNLYEFVRLYSSLKSFGLFYEVEGVNNKDIYQFIKGNWPDLKSEVKEFVNRDDLPLNQNMEGLRTDTKLRLVVKSYKTWLEGFEAYFDNMINGVPESRDVKEVMFDGPKYLTVNLEYFGKEYGMSDIDVLRDSLK